MLLLALALACGVRATVRLDRLELGAPQAVHVTNLDVGAIVHVRAVLHHHGTHASVNAVGYVDAGDSRSLPLDGELQLLAGCNLISIIDAAAGIRELVRVCRLPASGKLVSQALLDCAPHEWADNAHLCAARQAESCAAVCCACESATPRPTCCLAQRNVTDTFEWLDTFGETAYNGSAGATDWAYAPWVETQPSDDGLPDRGRISVALDGPGMRLTCVPQPAAPLATNVGCLFGLEMGVARVIYTPPCLDGRNLQLQLLYAGANATLRVTGADGTPGAGCPNVTLALPASPFPSALEISLTACADGLRLALDVHVAACDTSAYFVLYSVSVSGACAPREATIALPIDACGVCGGNATHVSQCTIGTLSGHAALGGTAPAPPRLRRPPRSHARACHMSLCVCLYACTPEPTRGKRDGRVAHAARQPAR